MTKPIVAVDIDDVLSASAAGWVKFSNATWGTSLSVEDYDEDWAKMWKVDHQTAVKRATIIHDSVGMVSAFQHDAEAVVVLRQLVKKYELVITSSRVQKHRLETIEWLNRHFDGIFSEIHLAGIFDELQEASVNLTKGDLIKRVGAQYLIDDQLKHCFAAVEHGAKAILFGDYSWNRSVTLPAGVARAKDWLAVQEYFDGQR